MVCLVRLINYNIILFEYKSFTSFLLKMVGDTNFYSSDLNTTHSNLLQSPFLKKLKFILLCSTSLLFIMKTQTHRQASTFQEPNGFAFLFEVIRNTIRRDRRLFTFYIVTEFVMVLHIFLLTFCLPV